MDLRTRGPSEAAAGRIVGSVFITATQRELVKTHAHDLSEANGASWLFWRRAAAGKNSTADVI